jgi:3-phosphoshikimate 1-carboxyvinyltransferase
MKIPNFDFERIEGRLKPPPDKSITHRALIIGSISEKTIIIRNPLLSGDTISTMNCLLKLGKEIEKKGKEIEIKPGKIKEPEEILYCGNSGTTARLLSGLLSGHDFFSVLDGDSSLRKRPMGRIVEPLREMGAIIHARGKDSVLPMAIKGGNLRGINYELKIPSAQVKSAIILSAIFADGETVIKENLKSRDHTERMLKWLGADITVEDKMIKIEGGSKISDGEITVPGDISSASFFICGATLVKGSKIVIENVGLNPTRTGILEILKRMGASIKILDLRKQCNEEIGEIEAKYSQLKGIEIEEHEIPFIIDEIPLISLLATQAEGITNIKGAKELRYKESDRIHALCDSLSKMGSKIEETEDGIVVEGPSLLRGAKVSSYGDHRIAMTLLIASLIAKGETIIDDLDCIKISYPNFINDLFSLCKS